MSLPRFQIYNRDALRAEQAVLPLARYVSRLLTSSGVIRQLSYEAHPPDNGWIVFEGDGERGFGVRIDHDATSLSPLQRSLHLVRCAKAVVRGFGGSRAFPFTLSLRASPPETWPVCKVVGVVSTVWCSSSIPAVEPPARRVGEERDPSVRARLFAFAPNVEDMTNGERLAIDDLALYLPAIGIVGRGVWKGGRMTMEVEERSDVIEPQVPGVRLDLGEIEVRLSDLVALRPGAVLDLGGASLERCFVRLGSTILAEGRFATNDGRLTLTIEAVM